MRTLGRFLANGLLALPDPQCQLFQPAVRAMSRMPIDERPDVMWATGTPQTTLLVEKRLAKNLCVPWIADFRDPWIGEYGYNFFSQRC